MTSQSLVNEIRVAHLAQQMRPNEFYKFVSAVSHTCGRDVILKALLKDTTDDQMSEAIGSASDILRSREENGRKKLDKQSISALDNDMIGSIAMYLNQTDYARFSNSNRAILIACNSPNTLRTIKLRSDSTYPAVNLIRFPALRSLEMDSSKFNLLNDGHCIINNLQHLRLNGLFTTEGMKKFMTQDFDGIKHFGFNVEHKEGHTRTPANYFELLAKFKNITHLELNDEFALNNIPNDAEFKQLFPNLIAFTSLNGACLANKMINLYCDKLRILSFKGNDDITIAADVNFIHLEELRISEASEKTLQSIMQTVTQLKKVRISWSANISSSSIKKTIRSIISTQCCLNYFETVSNQDAFECVFDAIERALFVKKQRLQKREYFKIKLLISCNLKKKIDLDDVMINFSRLKNVFIRSEIAEFMIICMLNGVDAPGNSELIEEYVNCFRDTEKPKVRTRAFLDEIKNHVIVMTNDCCNINGYSERWM